MAYLRIQPIDPGLEVMLAQVAHISAVAGGGKVKFSDFLINTVAPPKAETSEEGDFAEFLRARVKAKG